ncbi:hypothetical protein BD410DRAFT_758724 [Rickenella mellea]|uniref:Pre-rRNA-processing protein RIX1 n=1 Tax=Rickenella mellea TaxID=50990 RepID=A0A4R5XF05_9AGAM|nr:hypothetical protein BD410DRAFT_758724 [Rickenella mellea]
MDCLAHILQVHFASDESAVANLPFVLSLLRKETFSNSPNLTKWSTRVNSLIQSKDPGARWAGLCVALESARLRREFLMEGAQGWITAALPMLSRVERLAVWTAAIKLLAFIFVSTLGVPEFQRQLAIPNIPKFSLAIVTLVQKNNDQDLKILVMDTLTVLVPLFPNLHRALLPSISNLALQSLDGLHPTATPISVLQSASRLNACLHHTGGKVGSSTLWRKSVNEAIAFCWSALAALRTTYPQKGQVLTPNDSDVDALVAVPLKLDRLRCGITFLLELLRTTAPRPVLVPVAAVVSLAVAMLRSAPDEDAGGNFDRSLRAAEASVVPHILSDACDLLQNVIECVRYRITPHLSQILSLITYHLEQHRTVPQCLPFIRLLQSLLASTYPSHNPLLMGRLVKVILPSLSIFLQKHGETRQDVVNGEEQLKSQKGKKRARQYEGDEVFRAPPGLLCTHDEGELILLSIDALRSLLDTPNLAPYLHSIVSRVALSLLLTLPNIPSIVGVEPGLKHAILVMIRSLCVDVTIGTSTVLSNSLPLVVEPLTLGTLYDPQDKQNQRFMDIMLHPRLPPILRTIPPLDVVTLTQTDASQEEKTAMNSLGFANPNLNSKEPSTDVDVPSKTTNEDELMATRNASQNMSLTGQMTSSPNDVTKIHGNPIISSVMPDHSLHTEPGVSWSEPMQVDHTVAQQPASLEYPEPKMTDSLSTNKSIHEVDEPIYGISGTASLPQSTSGYSGEVNVDDEDIPPINMESDTDEE